MRFLIGTAHFFAPIYRDAGMHRFAKSLAAKGHHVDFVTFGQSRLKQRMKPETKAFVDSANGAAAADANPANIHAHVHREWFHPPSGSPRIERLTWPLERLYGHHLDAWTRKAAREADVIILECGYALYFFDTIRKFNPQAQYVAFYNDRLELVGFRPEVIALHERLMPRFDMVRTNAERLLDYLPAGVHGRYVAQGVDKERISFDLPSPYPAGTRNIVSVGNMLFDDAAVRAIAAAAARAGANVHVIGAAMAKPPANVVVHGELPFEVTLPYIVHADVGLAPYRATEGAEYLVQSSLKIQQYSYCGLPILLAKEMGIGGANFVQYAQGIPGDVDRAVDQAFELGKSRDFGRDVRGWDEIGDVLLATIAESPRRYGLSG
jgi:2-beta-glucuronyltransferase